MDKEQVLSDLRIIIMDIYGGANLSSEAITLDSNIHNDLGLDSMDMVELIMKLEQKYNFRLTAKEEEKLLLMRPTVGNVVDKVIEIVAKTPAQSVSDNASENGSLESIAQKIRQELQMFAGLPEQKISFTIEKTDSGYKLSCK